MNIPLRCECGTVTGFAETRGLSVHGACYCRDCQAFARFLGRPERMLDEAGGTEAIGNCSRTRKMPFVTLHIRALDVQPDQLEQAFGRSSFVFGAASATGAVASRPAGLL